ncbi:ABC transporter ATP-binding protein [bacterium DOLZORAL124_38_8]|nr:MAG: ABC transporter ATP-binding protein [bacterium DOLZORAL124_38_8]
MIQFIEVTKRFGSQLLLEDVNFAIHAKEKVGIIGRNGYGKSTIVKMILGQEEPNTGEIKIPNHYTIGTLEQHLNFTKDTLRDEAILGLKDEEKSDIWKAEKMLFGLGFEKKDLMKNPHEFSGGYQIRINLAKVLLSDPDLLILDEPTNYLDITSIRWLENFLKNWKRELMVVSHDKTFLDRVCSHTMMIHRKSIKKMRGGVDKIRNQIKEEEIIHEQTRKNFEKKRAKTEKFIREFRAGARSAGLVQSRIKMLDKQKVPPKLSRIEDIQFKFTPLNFNGDAFAKIHNLTFGFNLEHILLKDLCFEIQPGDKIAIIGANGKGKSTLLNLLLEKLSPLSGSIKKHPTLQINYFSQLHKDSLELTKNIFETLAESNTKVSEQDTRKICSNLLFKRGDVYKKIEVLSGGEKSRVNLGKILLTPAHLLLLDEPTNHLDLESVEALSPAIQNFEGAAIFITHDENLLKTAANKLIVFDNDNAFFFNGNYEQFLQEKGWSEEEPVKEIASEAPKDESPTAQLTFAQQKELKKLLRPLEKSIVQLEKQMTNQEDDLHTCLENLKTAERQGSQTKIETFSIQREQLRADIEKTFENLYEQTEKLEQTKSEFLEEHLPK